MEQENFEDIKGLSSYHKKLAELSLPELIIETVKAGQYAIVGGNVVGIYTKPRATLDVDILVDGETFQKVKKELQQQNVSYKETENAIESEAGFDLLNADTHPLWRAVLENRVPSGGFFIPTREGLIALKYLAAISPNRAYEDKGQDVADIVRLLDKADREKLIGLIRILGSHELELFKRDILEAYDKKKSIVI